MAAELYCFLSQRHQPRKVHFGLKNQGSTCYLNSVLQVLFMTTEIHNRLDPESGSTDHELRSIFEKLKENKCGTEKITACLKIENVNQQRDAAQCLEMILQKVSPRVSQVFQGQLTSTTKCSEGHIIIDETNPFWILPLPLKDSGDASFYVESNLEKIFEARKLSGANMVYCNQCEGKTEATSGCEMVESPQILILLLKRFEFDYNTMSYVKSQSNVGVPLLLQTKSKLYKLYGMVNHVGSLGGGHYTASILSKKDKTWYEFSDTNINKIEPQPCEKIPYNSSTAYLLVYRGAGKPIKNQKWFHNKVKEDDRASMQKGWIKCKKQKNEEAKEAPEIQTPTETNTGDQTDEVKEKQGEDISAEKLHGEEQLSKSNTGDKDNTEMGHAQEKDLKEETPVLQVGDEGESSGHNRAEEDRTHASITGGDSNPGGPKETNTDDARDVKEETKTEEKEQGASFLTEEMEITIL